MQPHIGSVYLDVPARPSRQQAAVHNAKRRRRANLAYACLLVGLASLTLSGLITGAQSLFIEAEPVADAFEDTLADPIARTELEREIAKGIEQNLVGPDLIAVAAAFDLDVAAEAERVSAVVLDDPTVHGELITLVEDIHHAMIIEASEQAPDLEPLTAAILAVIERESPRLALVVPADSTLWEVDESTFPDLTGAADTLSELQRYALIPALLIAVAIAVHPQRHRVAAWIGRWSLTVGLACGLAAIGLPRVLGSVTGFRTVEIVVREISSKLLGPAVFAGIVGVGLVTFAAVAKHREEREIANVGAAAAMGGFDEPPLAAPSHAPTLDLPSRGLVDVSHPLTNI